MKAVLSQSVFESDKKDVKVVYTALFGTGSKFVPDILEHAGYKNLRFVEEQMVENGDFPGLTKPNPQNKEAFAEAVKLAKKNGSDVILATDPDADRMGMAIRDDNGEYVVLTGNQIGVLLLDFIIKVKKEKGTLSPNAFVVKSLVSTELAADICKKNGVTLENVYTGFKYIGEKITEAENTQREFLFGFEESHGYLTGNYAKDKDGVAACLLAAELAQYHKEQGNTVLEALYNIYNEYGKYTEILHDITVKAVDFKKEIETFISNVRENIPKVLAGEDVIRVFDFLKREEKDLLNNTSSSIMLPSENMLMLETAESKLVLRPSGTEPKLKVYYFMKELDKYKSEEKQKQIEKQLKIDLL